MLETPAPSLTDTQTWGAFLEVAVCETCQWRYLLPTSLPARLCPNCCSSILAGLPGGLAEMPHSYPAELVLPFLLPESQLAQSLKAFCDGIPYAPEGLSVERLNKNLTRVFLPMWLVDANVTAQWQAEAGFLYEVVSHQETYDQNRSGWVSNEIKEPRVRWESRVGRLNRVYHNVAVPALEDAPRLEKLLGPFQQERALSYQPEHVQGSLIRLPDLPPNEAWAEAVPAFQKTSALECQQASSADQLRQFRWKARFAELNWTLMLQPVYATFYQDDHGQPRPVLIHGQTGKTNGQRQASLKRAAKSSQRILAASVLAVLIGLLLDVLFAGSSTGWAGFSTTMILFGFLGCLGAGVPYLIAVDFNRRQKPGE